VPLSETGTSKEGYMRPKSVVLFEQLFLSSFAFGLIQLGYFWRGKDVSNTAGLVFSVSIQALTFVILIALVLLISRKSSRVAMWILVSFYIFGIPAIYFLVVNDLFQGITVISVLQFILQTAAIACLFHPDSREWMKRKARK
jgi:glycerol-3-phosphate acyltransferase PlsY